jgi:hypothetical protein
MRQVHITFILYIRITILSCFFISSYITRDPPQVSPKQRKDQCFRGTLLRWFQIDSRSPNLSFYFSLKVIYILKGYIFVGVINTQNCVCQVILCGIFPKNAFLLWLLLYKSVTLLLCYFNCYISILYDESELEKCIMRLF